MNVRGGKIVVVLSVMAASTAWGWGGGFIDSVKKTGRQLDPTNPKGAVRNHIDGITRGVSDPLRVVRHAGDVLGVDLSGIPNPAEALDAAIVRFQKEGERLRGSVSRLTEIDLTIPDVKSPSFIAERIGRVRLDGVRLPTVSMIEPWPVLKTYRAIGERLTVAGKAIERFVMKDVPREGKRFGKDINREARRLGRDIDRETRAGLAALEAAYHRCFTEGHCFTFMEGFFGDPDDCESLADQQDELDCWEKRAREKRARVAAIRRRLDDYAKPVIDRINAQHAHGFKRTGVLFSEESHD